MRAKQPGVQTKERRSSKLRAGQADLLVDVLLIEGEGLLEHAAKLAKLALERALVLPRERGVEELAWDAVERGGDAEAKDGEGLVRRLRERARVHGVDDAARVLERAALACAELAARPACVDQPAVDVVLRHALGEHLGVAAGLKNRSDG